MLKKTEAVVLKPIKFRETSLIVKMYTETFGIRSFIVNGVRSKKSKIKASLFQPLSLLELVVYQRHTGDIDRMAEVKASMPFLNIPFDIRRSSTALFLTEILYKTIREEVPNPELFKFIIHTIKTLDREEKISTDFILIFLVRLSTFLGFGISSFREPIKQLSPETVFSEEEMQLITHIVINGRTDFSSGLNSQLRKKTLQCLLDFYDMHCENFYPLQSLKVIREVFA